jgi:GGDEF domain-containing protein
MIPQEPGCSSLSYQVSHDAPTGPINRREFEIACVGLESSKSNGELMLHCCTDLDQFGPTIVGHTAGDELLRKVTEVVQANIPRLTRCTALR